MKLEMERRMAGWQHQGPSRIDIVGLQFWGSLGRNRTDVSHGSRSHRFSHCLFVASEVSSSFGVFSLGSLYPLPVKKVNRSIRSATNLPQPFLSKSQFAVPWFYLSPFIADGLLLCLSVCRCRDTPLACFLRRCRFAKLGCSSVDR